MTVPGASSDPSRTSARLITTGEELDAIEERWRALAVARANPFVSPEWYRSWLVVADPETTPYAVAVEQDGELLGVLPFVLEHRGWRHTVRFAGADLGDHFHAACATEHEDDVALAAGALLRGSASEWNVLVLERASVAAPWARLIATSAGVASATVHRSHGVLPFADLDGAAGDWQRYLGTRSRNFREQVGRKRRALERSREVRLVRTEDTSTVRADAGTFLELHGRRWTAGGTTIATPRSQTFLVELAGRTLAAGWLRLWRLEVDGSPVAAFYGWHVGDRYLFYQSGRDPAWDRESVGFVLLARALQEAVEDRAAVFDLLLGDETYKSRFADSEHTVETLAHTRAGSGVRPFSWRIAQAGRARVATAAHALNIR